MQQNSNKQAQYASNDRNVAQINIPFANPGVQQAMEAVRAAFVRKVYGILITMLAVTFGFALLATYDHNVGNAVGIPAVLYGAIAVYFVTALGLICSRDLARKTPNNYIILSIFTAAASVMVGSVCAQYEDAPEIVVLAMIITLGIVVGLTIYAFTTKKDFTGLGPYLVCALWGLIIFGFMIPFYHDNILYNVFSLIGAFIFGFFVVYDTQMIINGKHKVKISTEEYIFAAINIYLDVINLFLRILSILGGGKK